MNSRRRVNSTVMWLPNSRATMRQIPLTVLLTLVVCISVEPALAQRRSNRPKPPIIDVHLHAFGFDEYGNPPPPNEITGKRPTARNDKEAMDASLAAMKRHNIVKAVASGPLEDVLRWREAAPDRIIGGAYFGARSALPEVSILRNEFVAGRLGVMGELGLQYGGLSPNDPQLEPYFALAEELDIPIGLHTGLGDSGTPYSCCPKFRVTLGNPVLLEEVLIRHPKLRVYIMHAGWPYQRETIAIMYMYPQVYADLAVINWAIPREEFHEYLRGLMRAGMGRRLMFGSDQMVWPEAIGLAIEGIASAKFLTAEQKRDIFYNNAAEFLKLNNK
jgi:predicted TIM-barrel fold metal-dependent hydrolase